MRLCAIGGTRFSGRAFTGAALAAGHDVTVFHRGEGSDDPWPDATHVHGDRADTLEALSGHTFDAIVDFCAYVPREIRQATEVLQDGRYVFISSVSAHRFDARAGATEDDDVWTPPFPDGEEITWETYGPLKVACERALVDARGDQATIVRPHYIVGPHDPSDRFTSWVRRGASGDPFVAPAPPEQPLQWIDARDLASFVLHVCEIDMPGTFNVATPPRRYTLGDVLTASAAAAGATARVAWADETFVRTHDLVASEDGGDPFPLVTPDEPNAHLFDTSRAVAGGLTFRPLDETVADTLAWDRDRGLPPLQAGLDPAREATLLAELGGAG
jgi:2'-hydroxyisoflavone reductase